MRPLEMDDPAWIGDYRLLGLLGSGGMGRVYLGRSAGGRTVAVKVIRPDLIGDTQFRERFRREVTAARRVGGQFTAAVLDADVDADPPWLATGYVAGFSLTEAVDQFGPFTENALLVLAHGLAEALIAVHGVGVVHRDLKPSNVLLAIDGPKVIDFGIARAIEDSALTTTGSVIGSPSFMCPEQVLASPVGPAADVFALGGVLVFAATGHGPFGVGDTVQMLFRVVYEEPQLDGVPQRLRPLIAACLAKDAAARPTPDQLLAALQDIGVPQRAGWLPAPVLEEVSRRAVQLLDLDSGPVRVPDSLRGQPMDPSRSDPTISRLEQGYLPTIQSRTRDAGHYGAPAQSVGSPQPPLSYSDEATQSSWSGQHDAPQQWSGYQRAAMPGPPPSGDSPPPAARPEKSSGGRRVALITGAVVACVVVAGGAFVIGGQLKGDSTAAADTTPTAAATSQVPASSAAVETSSATSTTTAADDGASVPSAFVGHWTGVARDVIVSFDIDLKIRDGKTGEEIGKSSNTGSVAHEKCTRVESLNTVGTNEITLIAQLVNSSTNCMDNGSISTLTLRPDGTLNYSMPGILGPITGVLTKKD
ncbi:serine/threonine-protein kinase [Nocardia australiensis]|uniref:serine/threonine-protein kinase n=1 Tax=Nocardia australiensis TaxID=2887191 RepID=UPI001D13FB65|nr:serine/threonine-protein kinase [Nocardia australiensis]